MQRANQDAPPLEARRTRLEKLDMNFAREENTFLVSPVGTTGVDWWPYTWAGAQGFAPPPAITPALTPTQTQEPPSITTPAPSTSSTSSVTQMSAASSLISSASFAGTTVSTSSSPSGTSDASVRTVNTTSPFKLYLLGPIIGGVVLALLAVCIICRRRRHRRHRDTVSTLEAGPRYETYESKPFYPVDGMQHVSLLRPDAQRIMADPRPSNRRSRRSKRSTRGVAHQGLTAASRSTNTLGFPELSERPDSPSIYSMPSRGPSRAMTVLSAHPKNAGADEEYERLRRKSTRRGHAGGGAGYRAVSDEELDEDDEMFAYYEPRSAVSARSGPGFRIVQEDPPSPSALASDAGASWLAWTRGWSASNLNLAEQGPPPSGHSHFTPKPTRRRDRTSPSSSTATTPTARTPTRSRAHSRATSPARSRPHSRATTPARDQPPLVAMLPASPPLVSSPQFNAALTFGGPDPSARTMAPSRRKERATSPPSRETTRKHHHHHSVRETKLPYPGDATAVGHRSAGREQRRTLSPPPPLEKQVSDVSETMLRATSPQEREGALDKVDAIVARGIVQQRVASEVSETVGWMSIQQRLEMLG